MPIEPPPESNPPAPETRSRRDEFLGGLPVRLADGQEWAFAGPRELGAADPALRAEVMGLIAAIAEAQDEPERLRGELALGICLLAANYELSPADFIRLLDWAPGDPGKAAMQSAFRSLAGRHFEASQLRKLSPPSTTPGRRFRLPAFRPLRHKVDRRRQIG